MMKYLLLSAAMALALLATPARANLVADGITYSVASSGLNTSTANFQITITGINAAADTEGGRASVHAFAFSTNSLLPGLTGTSSFGTFAMGGLNSSGCNGSGGFFCFNNASASSTPVLPAGSTIVIPFSLTLASGTFTAWANSNPDFKIDWLGTQNNYDLVSLGGTGVNVNMFSVPGPIVGAGLPGLIAACAGLLAFARRRRQKFEFA
jgi:hypothetical protein